MDPAVRESALWGVTGGLLFLVLAFGYRLAVGVDLSVLVVLLVGILVAVATTGLSYLIGQWLP